MKVYRQKETKVIEYTTEREFEERVNSVLATLAKEGREVEVATIGANPIVTIISYEKEVNVAQTLKDAYALEGIVNTCKDCHEFTEYKDQRLCRGFCKHTKELARKDQRVCDHWYELRDNAKDYL